MIQLLALIFGMILVSIPVMAQIYNNKSDEILAPLDNAVEQANAIYSNAGFPGDAENAKPQDIRYNEMTAPQNAANERHLKPFENKIP